MSLPQQDLIAAVSDRKPLHGDMTYCAIMPLKASVDASRLNATDLEHADLCQWLHQYCAADSSSRTTDAALWQACQEDHDLPTGDSTRVPLAFRRAIFCTFPTARLTFGTGFGGVERSIIDGVRPRGLASGYNPLGIPSTVEIHYHVPITGIMPSLLRHIFAVRVPNELSLDFEARVTVATVMEEESGLLFRSCRKGAHGGHDDLSRMVDCAAAAFAVYPPFSLAPSLIDEFRRTMQAKFRDALLTRAYALQDFHNSREKSKASLHDSSEAEAWFLSAHE